MASNSRRAVLKRLNQLILRAGKASCWPAGLRPGGLCYLALLLSCSVLTACRSVPPLPAVDLTETGWQVREGQALWRSQRNAPPIAGELLLATNPDGRAWVQFSKTPLPFLTAQTTATNWQIEFAFEKRSFRGAGQPPVRLLWLHLARALNGAVSPAPLRFDQLKDGGARLENTASGETVTIYLAP